MSSLWSLRRPWDNAHTMVLEREGEMGCWIQVPGNRVPGNRVPGNRARLAAGKDNMTTITFGRSTVE